MIFWLLFIRFVDQVGPQFGSWGAGYSLQHQVVEKVRRFRFLGRLCKEEPVIRIVKRWSWSSEGWIGVSKPQSPRRPPLQRKRTIKVSDDGHSRSVTNTQGLRRRTFKVCDGHSRSTMADTQGLQWRTLKFCDFSLYGPASASYRSVLDQFKSIVKETGGANNPSAFGLHSMSTVGLV